MQNRGWLTWFGGALTIGGAASLFWWGYSTHEAAVAQQRARQWLRQTAAAPRAASTSPAPKVELKARRSVRQGDVVGELDIPRLHLSVMVFEGDDAKVLRLGAGHIPGTAFPNGKGNVGIAAHRDTYFRPLRGIRSNDLILLKTATGTARYAVTQTEVVRPTDIGVLARGPGRDLTLVTCYPFYFVGSAPKRFIVHSRAIG